MAYHESGISRRQAILGSAALSTLALTPAPAQAFLFAFARAVPGLLARFVGGTVARGAVARTAGSAAATRAAGSAATRSAAKTRNASSRLQNQTDRHIARAGFQQATQLVFSDQLAPEIRSSLPDGAEVTLSQAPERELVSFVTDPVRPVTLAHPLQIRVMDNASRHLTAWYGPRAPMDFIYPIHLLHSEGSYGFQFVRYQALLGEVEIQVRQYSPTWSEAHLRVYSPRLWLPKPFRSGRIRRPDCYYFG